MGSEIEIPSVASDTDSETDRQNKRRSWWSALSRNSQGTLSTALGIPIAAFSVCRACGRKIPVFFSANMAAEDLMEAGVKQDTSTKVATIAHKPPETPRNRTVTGPPRCTQKRTIEAKIQSCASPFTTPSGTVQSLGLAFSPAQQKLSNQGLKEALSSTHSTGGCSFGESFDGNFSFHDVTGTSFEATQTASDPSSGKEIGSPPEVQGLTDRGACPTVPWIIDRPGRGLEVSKAARTVLSPLPSPVCVVLFYSECASGARRNEIVMRTLFPQHIPQAPSARQRDEGSTRTLNVSTIAEEGGDEDEESVVVRLWKKPVRVRTGSNKKVTVVVAEASPGPSTPEGLVLALSVLLCSHMVFTGEDKILEETHIHELRDVQALTRHVRTRGEEDEEDGLAFKQYFPRLTWLFQDFEACSYHSVASTVLSFVCAWVDLSVDPCHLATDFADATFRSLCFTHRARCWMTRATSFQTNAISTSCCESTVSVRCVSNIAAFLE